MEQANLAILPNTGFPWHRISSLKKLNTMAIPLFVCQDSEKSFVACSFVRVPSNSPGALR